MARRLGSAQACKAREFPSPFCDRWVCCAAKADPPDGSWGTGPGLARVGSPSEPVVGSVLEAARSAQELERGVQELVYLSDRREHRPSYSNHLGSCPARASPDRQSDDGRSSEPNDHPRVDQAPAGGEVPAGQGGHPHGSAGPHPKHVQFRSRGRDRHDSGTGVSPCESHESGRCRDYQSTGGGCRLQPVVIGEEDPEVGPDRHGRCQVDGVKRSQMRRLQLRRAI